MKLLSNTLLLCLALQGLTDAAPTDQEGAAVAGLSTITFTLVNTGPIREGDTVTMKCESNNRELEFEFTKNKTHLHGEGGAAAVLVLQSVKRTDVGVYRCQAFDFDNIDLELIEEINLSSIGYDDHLQHLLPDRCDGVEFDAITPDEEGNIFFFKGAWLWKGFSAAARPSNETFKELHGDQCGHHLGHVDAAFLLHAEDDPTDRDHINFFQDDKVFSYNNHTLEEGYPKDIQQDFPGIPSQLDAAVECPKGECITDSVLFFKGHDVYIFDLATKTARNETWSHLPVCTSALRWQEHYYCFHGHNFTRFNQRTGEVAGGDYPKDARDYFMACAHLVLDTGGQNGMDHVIIKKPVQKKVDHFVNNGLLKFYRKVFEDVLKLYNRGVLEFDGYLKNDPDYFLYKNTITNNNVLAFITTMGAVATDKPSGGDDNAKAFSAAFKPLVEVSVGYVNRLYVCKLSYPATDLASAYQHPPSGFAELPGLRRHVNDAAGHLRNVRAAWFDDDAYNRWKGTAKPKEKQTVAHQIEGAEHEVKKMLTEIVDHLPTFTDKMYKMMHPPHH